MYIWNEVDTEEHAPLRGGHYMYYYTPQMSMPLFRKSPISAGLFCNRNCNRDMICKEPANYGYLTMLLHCSLSPTCTNSFSAYRPDCPAENTPRDTAKINLVFVLWLCCFLMQPVGWRQDWRVIIRVMHSEWVKGHDTSHGTLVMQPLGWTNEWRGMIRVIRRVMTRVRLPSEWLRSLFSLKLIVKVPSQSVMIRVMELVRPLQWAPMKREFATCREYARTLSSEFLLGWRR